MELSQFTDFSLRALIYAGSKGEELCTVPEVARAFGISQNHLVKVVNNLAKLDYVWTQRGRNGGFQLARSPKEICIGGLVRQTETLHLVECFDEIRNSCPMRNACVLERVLHEAQNAFLEVLDSYTLADFISKNPLLSQLNLSLESTT